MEPIAIVGIACRLPGAESPAAYWDLLVRGVEAVREPPFERPELEPPPWLVEQAPHCRRGGFLENLDRFDPGFFRISPREAARMDPQQRLLLEVAWEALEDAGQLVAPLSGTNTGVFVGIMNADFARRHAQDLSQIDAQFGPGCSLGIASNRISFYLDLRGPSMSIDTLCSSSLVAIHLACQSLQTGESSPLAIAGGVNVILDRTMDVFYARAGLLSADGRCRAFDASARGIVRGEGVGLVVLKRLSRARADGDHIHAVILGSAVNQDGRSNGLTSPSRWSQEEVLRTAYRRAGVAPSSVPYIEAHGTGTLIGDPIEMAALGAVLGEGRALGQSCAIGSVKTNLGHLESAAGVASLLKVVLSLERRTLAPSLNFETPNPYLCLNESRLRVQTRTEPWPDAEFVAGVSSFGMGGTNVHVVLGAVDLPEASRTLTERACLIPISARSVPAVDALEVRYAELLSSHGVALGDVAHSAAMRRDHHDHRRARVMRSATDVAYSVSGSVVPGRIHKLVFVLPDKVACERSSGDELAESEPVFREAMQQSLAEGATHLVAFQSGLAALWRAFGFEPDEVLKVSGDGTGKIAASLGPDGTVFVELSPCPVMLGTLRGIFERAGVPGAAIPSVVPGFGERASILRAIAEMYCLGFNIDWKRLDERNGRFVPLGSYPWQKEYSWLDLAAPTGASVLPQGVVVPSWVRASIPTSSPSPSRASEGEWLVLGDEGTTAKALVTRFGDAGYRARMVRAVEELASSAALQGVVQFCGRDLGPTVRLVQALGQRSGAGSPRLWLVTRGACVVDDDTSLAALASSQIWGLGRVAVNEHPPLRPTLVDLSSTEHATDADMLFAELSSDSGELEVAIRGIDRYVARLGRQPLATSKSRLQLRSDAAYLITGGLGGLGLAAAARLIDRGARTVVLLGRSGIASDEASAAVAKLSARGANVIVERVDVSDRYALAEVLRRHRVRGVIHAAGVMSPAMIMAIDSNNLAASIAAKVDGARYLHELLATEPLDFFVMYSSVATILGMPGQGAYAAANAYLDALAEHRRAIGLCATSIGWTVIENTGMAANAGEKAMGQLAARGVSSLPIRSATDLLEHFLGAETPAHLGAVNFDLRRWTAFYPHAKSIPRLQPLTDGDASRTDGALAQNLRALKQTDRIRPLETYLCQVAAKVLHHSEAISPDQLLFDLGIDSLTALELQTMVEDELAITLPTERLLLGPSVRELAKEIAAIIGGETSTIEASAPLSLRAEVDLEEAITFAPPEDASSRTIFLTGATGFLGAFVLAELLEHTSATICCLVRGQSAGEGMHRLEGVLGRHHLSALSLTARVTCIPGDLAKPRLGLGANDYDRLASSVDTIFHSGALVNFAFPYQALKASNVGGTREVLRLASAARSRLHYVSTIGIFPGGPGHLDRVFEDARPEEPDQLALGYMRAKWVAEALVMQARERGLNVSIYRPGTISGHSTSGAFNPDDFVCAMIKGCVELGLAPRVDTMINLAPVDYVSRALVGIALGAGGSSGEYHLVGPRPVAWTDVVAWIRALGYRLEEMPYAEWRQVLVERAEITGNALAPLLPLFVDHDSTDWLQLPPYDDARAARALVGTGIACPPVDASLVRRYVERFVVSGYLPRPR